jgi:succinoglycan biosynthesis protein ExoA
MPTVSVILPCRNEGDHIEACVSSIFGQQSAPGEIEIIVADGMSTDKTRDILERLSSQDDRLKVIDNPERIVSTGLNAAIAVARGKIIMRMDAHTEYANDYIRQCLAVRRETGADNVGGPARTIGEGYVQIVISAGYHSAFSVGGARFHDPDYEGYVDTVPYGCWRREVFNRVGLFDEGLIRNQDDEFNLRLKRAGGTIWQSPRIRSWYRPRGSLIALFRQYMQYGYWKVRVIQKHRWAASVRHLVPGCFVFVLLVLVPTSIWWPRAAWGWMGLLATYVAANLLASTLTARLKGWKLLPLLPVVFACYHFAYGLGFLRGIYDFVIQRHGPAIGFSKLTRHSASS